MTDTFDTNRDEAGAHRQDVAVRVEELDAWFVSEVLPLEASLTQYFRHNWRDSSNVADFLQDVYLRVYEVARNELPKSTKSFVFTTAHHLLVDRVRREKVVPLEAVDDLEALSIPTDAPSPEAHAVARDELRKMQVALDHLPARMREAFTLHHMMGLSVREIAVRMNIVERTVTWHLNEGLRIIANILYRDLPSKRVGR